MTFLPMRTPVARAALLLIAASPAPAALGEPVDTSIAQAGAHVTVIGRRLTSTAPGEEAARAEAMRVPGGANVVSSDEYADGRASTLEDMFALTPGVFAQSRFGAEEARLSIRGSGLQRTFHMRGINLLQDGVPITLADGSGDFQAIEPLSLAYTEVLRGANALQYGATTLGGAVNFVSPSGYDSEAFRTRFEGGDFDYRRALIGGGDVVGGLDYFVSASAYEQSGSRDWSQQENMRLFGNVGFKLNDHVESRVFFGAVHSDSQLPGSLTKAQLESDGTQANAGNLAARQKRDFDLYRLADRTVIDLDRRFIELSFGYGYKDLWHPIFQVLEQRSNDYNAGVRYVDERSIGTHANRLVLGVQPTWNEVQDDRFMNVGGEKGARTADSEQRSRNLVLYGQNELALNAGWTLVAGAQWTDSQRRYQDFFLTNGDQGLDASYTRLSPKLGFLWQADPRWMVFGNMSDSFEPPTFGELSGGAGVNPLDAQTARTAELGTRGKTSNVEWDVVAYTARVHDELLSFSTPTGQPLGTVNAPRTVHRGLEAGLDVRWASWLSWRSSYLWNDFRFDGDPTYGDRGLPGIPEHFYRGELTFTPRTSHYLTLNAEWSPERYAIDMAHSWFADSYAIWGARVGHDSDRALSWFLEVRNLTDQKYASTTGVIADARGQDTAQFLPGDGRAFYVGFDWRID